MFRNYISQLEAEARAEEKIANIYGSIPLIKLSDYPCFKGNNSSMLTMPSMLEYGLMAIIPLDDYETIVPNGKEVIDRKGYYYLDGVFTEPMHTLSEWREACPDNEKPHLLINANWFNIWESGIPDKGCKINPRAFDRTFLTGLAVSNGKIVSEHTVLDQGNIAFDSLVLDKKLRTARILSSRDMSQLTQANNFSFKNKDAVSGFILLKDGNIVPTPNKNNNAQNLSARTGVGVSEDGKKLYILVIQPGIKQCGVTADEFARIFKTLGVKDAINLDNNGSTELLYVGTNGFGQSSKIQTETSDIKADGSRDSERPKANFIGFYPKKKKGFKARDDSYTLFANRRQWQDKMHYAKDDLELIKDKPDLKYDSNFNNRRKTLYESRLAQLVMQNETLFDETTRKVSKLIELDIKRIAEDTFSQTSAAMRTYFTNDYDLTVLFGQYKQNGNTFYDEIIKALQNKASNNFYKQMCIHRAYITYFMEKGAAKPSLQLAKDEGWVSAYLDFDKMLYDVTRWRKGLFEENTRKTRAYNNGCDKSKLSIFERTSKNIGLLPGNEYKFLPAPEREKLVDQLPIHRVGMYEYYITTKGIFADSGMHQFDMPQVCGPSGMTAMRLALANQAGLSQSEKELYAFAVCMYHVAIGAHTVDEGFCIGNKGEFNHYQRGNYSSILPMALVQDNAFQNLFNTIKALNTEFSDLFPEHDKSFKFCQY